MNPLRILVADDNESMRAAYKKILETRVGFEVVGMASDGQEALEKYNELEPDVVILDVRMPKLDGLAVANRIMSGSSPAGIVLASAYDDLAFARAIMHDDASRKAYVLKSSLANISEFIRIVEAVAKGQAVLHENMIKSLMERYHRMPDSEAPQITGIEEDILKLMLEGYDESEIAQKLDQPFQQVDLLADSICEKLGVLKQDGVSRSPQVVQAVVNLCIY